MCVADAHAGKTVRCAGCGSKLRLRPHHPGKHIKCPQCEHVLHVPAGAPPAEAATAAPPAATRPPPKRKAASGSARDTWFLPSHNGSGRFCCYGHSNWAVIAYEALGLHVF